MNIRTLAAAVLALGLSACAAEFNGVGIYAICAPPDPDTTSGSCLYPATCDATFAGTPVLDVTTAQLDFRLPFQIDNQLPDNSNAADGRINTNDAFIESFEMTYAGATLEPWTVARPSPCRRPAPPARSCGSSRSRTSRPSSHPAPGGSASS